MELVSRIGDGERLAARRLQHRGKVANAANQGGIGRQPSLAVATAEVDGAGVAQGGIAGSV